MMQAASQGPAARVRSIVGGVWVVRVGREPRTKPSPLKCSWPVSALLILISLKTKKKKTVGAIS